jgi:hypothetical protein
MNSPLPLDKKEGEQLEFKSRRILGDPEKVARAAVAMLNASGGEVWIGIMEAPGSNVVEPIEEVERERARLQDRLLDLIEPRCLHNEVAVTVEGEGQGGPVLRVALTPDSRRQPFALLGANGGRYFLRRFDNRIVPMTREEIRDAFVKHPSGGEGAETPEKLRIERTRLTSSNARRFSLLLEPAVRGRLRLERLEETGILADPTCTGTPRSSYNYAAAFHHGGAAADHEGGENLLRTGDDALSLRVYAGGGIRFASSLESLAGGGIFDPSGKPLFGTAQVLSPEALLGYTISSFRLASQLLASDDLWDGLPAPPMWAALFIAEFEGYVLLPGLDSLAWRYEVERHRYADKDYFGEPLAFRFEDVQQHPDTCGLRLLRPLYWRFGWRREDHVPSPQGVGLGKPRL